MGSEYNGEAFLDKIYPGLHTSEEVLHTEDKSKTNAENIRTYLERLERVHSKANTSSKLEILLSYYYEKYVVKENDIDESKIMNGLSKNDIINNQKRIIKSWITYLSSDDACYPLWAKYWAFQGMLKIGNYNELYNPNNPKTGKAFTSRSKKTISPFIECNPELIAKAIDLMVKYNNGRELNDEEVERIIESGSFSKIYGILEYRYREQLKKLTTSTEGIWIKYNQGNEEDAKRLSASLDGYNTHWCTASESTAINQLCGPYTNAAKGGDFYVYYTLDEKGEYKIPKIAIRMKDHNYIAEIRGVEPSQNLTLGFEEILSKKLSDIDGLDEPSKEKALITLEDLKELTKIYTKFKTGSLLNHDEVHNILFKKYGFGWEYEPRVRKMELSGFTELLDESVYADKDLLIEYISRCGKNVEKIKEKFKDDEDVMFIALRKDYRNYNYLSPRLKSDHKYMCEILRYNGEIYTLLSEEEKRDKKYILNALSSSGDLIDIIPEDIIDKEIVRVSINSGGLICKNRINIILKYKNVVMDAIMECTPSLRNIPTDCEYYFELCKKVIKKRYNSIIYVPANYKSYKELAMYAIDISINALDYIKKEVPFYDELLDYAVEKNPLAIKYCKPNHKKYDELIFKAVSKDGNVIKTVSKKYKDYDKLKFIAIKSEPSLIRSFYDDKDYVKLAKEAIDSNIWSAVLGLNKEDATYIELYKYAIDKNASEALQAFDADNPFFKPIAYYFVKKLDYSINVILEKYISYYGHKDLDNSLIKYLVKESLESNPNNIRYIPLWVEFDNELNRLVFRDLSKQDIGNKKGIDEVLEEFIRVYRNKVYTYISLNQVKPNKIQYTLGILNVRLAKLGSKFKIQKMFMQLEDDVSVSKKTV